MFVCNLFITHNDLVYSSSFCLSTCQFAYTVLSVLLVLLSWFVIVYLIDCLLWAECIIRCIMQFKSLLDVCMCAFLFDCYLFFCLSSCLQALPVCLHAIWLGNMIHCIDSYKYALIYEILSLLFICIILTHYLLALMFYFVCL